MKYSSVVVVFVLLFLCFFCHGFTLMQSCKLKEL